jgi:hypothetical protein
MTTKRNSLESTLKNNRKKQEKKTQIIQWQKENIQKDKQCSTKHYTER